MRRVALLTTSCLLVLVVAGCRHDGRTLRPASPDQDATVSTTSEPSTDDPTFVDPQASVATLPGAGTLRVVAPWSEGGAIDARYTCDGENLAPALSWSPAPAGTAEIALTLTDLDAPGFAHWVIAGLAPQSIALNEDTVPLDAYEATNGNGDLGYTGPCPPSGSSHRYVVAVHYLGTVTDLDNGASAAELIDAISSIETASAEVTGTFSRS